MCELHVIHNRDTFIYVFTCVDTVSLQPYRGTHKMTVEITRPLIQHRHGYDTL